MVTLESDRLVLRNYQASDLPDYHKMMSDKVNMYYLNDITTNSLDESQKSLADAIEVNEKGKARRFCITLKENGKLIGAVGYEIPFELPVGKIADPMGWFLMPEYHSNGYMTEAVKRVLAFAFLQDNCIRVVTGCYKDNIPSHKVIMKTGFRQEAEKIQAMWHDGQMKDRLEFAINRNEYI
jgi:ribosomal-protein-alanine N-acetyltransferase